VLIEGIGSRGMTIGGKMGITEVHKQATAITGYLPGQTIKHTNNNTCYGVLAASSMVTLRVCRLLLSKSDDIIVRLTSG